MKLPSRTLTITAIALMLFAGLSFYTGDAGAQTATSLPKSNPQADASTTQTIDSPDASISEPTDELQKPAESSQDLSDDRSIPTTLKTLIWSWKEIEMQINQKREAAKFAATPEEKAAINAEIAELNLKLIELKNDFENLATSVDLSGFKKDQGVMFKWEDEVLKLLQPLIQELNRMTARPRQIEDLRGQIELSENRLETLQRGITHLKGLLEQSDIENKVLRKHLNDLLDGYTNMKTQIEDQLTVDQYQLDELLKQRQSFWKVGGQVLKSFFKSRGRNLVLALIVFVAIFLIMRLLHRLIHRYSPVHQKKERTLFIRLSDVIYHIITVVGSTAASLAVLYLAGDWLLLSFMIIILIGVAFSAKAGLPRYWKQIQLMLNLGAVREGERIVYNGIPWKVASLSLYSTLENPMFEPNAIMIPITELFDSHSRKYDSNEPWFPSQIGDWVITSDGVRGQVLSQTAEMVQLELRGGSRKTYQTQDYLGLSPHNLSSSFRVKVVFGLDYQHQAAIVDEIPAKLTAALRQGFTEKGYGEDVLELKTEIQDAGASSLNLVVIADFDGKTGAFYNRFKRIIQTLTIQACTANNWDIPFPQLTLHRPGDNNSEEIRGAAVCEA